MKISVLLTRYFYQHKVLNLPGIGSFTIDESVTVPDPSDKNFHEFFQYIRFIRKPIIKADDELIDFIRKEAGKIRPLAESDLESFISEGQLLLNIGKNFHIDGIGTLQKRGNSYEFIPGGLTLEKIDATLSNRSDEKSAWSRPAYGENYAAQEAKQNIIRKLLIVGVVMIGLGIIVGGGYLLYNRNAKSTNSLTSSENTTNTESNKLADSSLKVSKDSVVKPIDSSSVKSVRSPGSYKFVFETTDNKSRALKRFAYLRTLSSRIKMETKDSLIFKLYAILPSLPSDTARKKDSLNSWYWGDRKMKIKIEQ